MRRHALPNTPPQKLWPLSDFLAAVAADKSEYFIIDNTVGFSLRSYQDSEIGGLSAYVLDEHAETIGTSIDIRSPALITEKNTLSTFSQRSRHRRPINPSIVDTVIEGDDFDTVERPLQEYEDRLSTILSADEVCNSIQSVRRAVDERRQATNQNIHETLAKMKLVHGTIDNKFYGLFLDRIGMSTDSTRTNATTAYGFGETPTTPPVHDRQEYLHAGVKSAVCTMVGDLIDTTIYEFADDAQFLSSKGYETVGEDAIRIGETLSSLQQSINRYADRLDAHQAALSLERSPTFVRQTERQLQRATNLGLDNVVSYE